jgi:integrase
MTDHDDGPGTKRRKVNRVDFGTVRKLPSGRYQARYPDEAGVRMNAPMTFATKQEALDHIAEVRADRLRGSYINPSHGAVKFGEYAREWIGNGGTRGKLAPRTGDLYLDILTRQLATFDGMPLRSIRPETVRTWYSATRRELAKSARRRSGSGETRLRQSYALLRAILGTAVGDRLIAENPAKIKSAGVSNSPERPYMSPMQFAQIVAAHQPHIRPALTLAYGAHLRLGELIALQRHDLDLVAGTLRVERQTVTTKGQTLTTPTKTGTARVVVLPQSIVVAMSDYLTGLSTPPIGEGWLFSMDDGRRFTRTQLQQAWRKACRLVGLDQFHLHDIRHAGLTTAAQAGATVRELMQRAGHRSSAVALTYQHAAEERGRIIAAGIDVPLSAALEDSKGTQRARSAAQELPA